jgi:hypothetical protein
MTAPKVLEDLLLSYKMKSKKYQSEQFQISQSEQFQISQSEQFQNLREKS